MTRPGRYLVRMIVFLIAVAATVALLFEPLKQAFLTNPAINGLILGVLLLGIIFSFRQVLRLWPEVDWIETFRSSRALGGSPPQPRLLAPMAAMVGERSAGRLSLSATAMRSLLDGVASRLDEARDISRYTIGLLVFLGLLGTFWGLMQTVGSIGDVIRSLTVAGGDVATVFADLKRGLEAPLAGMGTAFTSSLFGLGGSLVLGFLDLQAGQAQNRFFNDLEDWLSGVTRLSSGTLVADGDHPVPAYIQALLEQTAESLDGLQQTLSRGEESRSAMLTPLTALNETIALLADRLKGEQTLLSQVADGQAELKPVLARLADTLAKASMGGIDEATRGHIRNIEILLARLIDDSINGREDLIRQVRTDIKLLARTIAAVSEDSER